MEDDLISKAYAFFGKMKLRNITKDDDYDNEQDTKRFNKMVQSMISEDHASLYGVYKSVVTGVGEIAKDETVNIPTSTDEKTNNGIKYLSWDPRLSRVDGFVTNDQGTHPTIIPFASETAASAFYDLVFTIERGIDNAIQKNIGLDEGNNDTMTNDAAKAANDALALRNPAHLVQNTEKIFRATKDVKDSVLNDGLSYGIASIMNPYTLTKLCGGLTKLNKTSEGGDPVEVENHMYDIRNSRRFYGDVITLGVLDVLSVSNPTTTNIITYSNNDPWGRTPYYFLDFVFCKFWKIIPNNHLITLRKYHAPVYDNLQFSSMFDKNGKENGTLPFAPIATVVSYFGEDTGNTLLSFFSFSTGTKWKDIQTNVHLVTGDTGSDPHALMDLIFTGGGGFTGAESRLILNLFSGANFLTGKMFSFGKFVGLLSPDGYNINKDQAYFEKVTQANVDPTELLYSNKIIGPVNRVDSTKARDAGITFDLKINVTCLYVARPIGGVNTKAALLDILANCMEIASVDAMFWGGGYHFNIKPLMYPFKNTAFKNRIMDDLYAGRIFGKDGALAHTVEGVKQFGTTDKDGNPTGSFDWSNITSKLSEVLGDTLGAVGEMLNSISNTIFGSSTSLGEWLKGAADNVSEGSGDRGSKMVKALGNNLNQMWRSQVVQRSMMPSLHGMKAVLTGEPVGNWHLTIGNPLNPIMVIGNLICTDMKVEAGEELGPDDFPMEIKVTYTLEHAMARDKSGILSMFNRGMGRIYQLPDWMRASSDYESKVDDYTGPSGDGSFYTPEYMNVSKLMKMGGTGFLTYKLAPERVMPMSAHTDSVVISKFTPPDVDAAISNIKEDAPLFFGANAGSRAWIRGIAATRKLMN